MKLEIVFKREEKKKEKKIMIFQAPNKWQQINQKTKQNKKIKIKSFCGLTKGISPQNLLIVCPCHDK